MSENRIPDKSREEEFLDRNHEPIDSIEKTVEDLKKKIQELSEEQEAASENAEPTTSEKIAEFTDNAKEIVSASIDALQKKASQAKDNADLQKTIAYVRENAMKAVTVAKDRIEEIRKDPKTVENTEKAKDAVKELSETVSEKAQKAADYISGRIDDDTKQSLQDAYDKTSKAISEGAKKVAEEVNGFCSREDVQETVTKARETASKWLNKGADTLNDLLGRRNGDRE